MDEGRNARREPLDGDGRDEPRTLATGSELLIGRYRILERIGAGGAGDVYRAEDTQLGRAVAIKRIEMGAPGPGALAEARVLASLDHASIATVYELIEQDGTAAIVMELVEGETLACRLARSPLDITEAVEIARRVGEALDAAHTRGVLHCDLTAANVMLTLDGRVKVLDFGLARLRGAECAGTAVAGTAPYMSPEQARGDADLDARTDVFSLGVLLYEMVAGRRPFVGETRGAVLRAVIHESPPLAGSLREGVPLELESILRRALEKDRAERYPSTHALVDDLARLAERLGAGHSIHPTTSEPVESEPPAYSEFRPHASRRFRPWLLAAAALVASAAAIDSVARGSASGEDVALFALAGAVAAYAGLQRAPTTLAAPLPKSVAFRGLLPFQEADRDRFYGRGVETAAVADMVAHADFRFGVLYGESGCGKTSLLRAGLIPVLWDRGFVPVYCRAYADPLAAIVAACRDRTAIARREDEDAIAYLRRIARELGSTVIVICDQFEEFFVAHASPDAREPFVAFLSACQDDSAVRVLVAMRSDFLYLVDAELAGRISEPLMTSRLSHLRNFDEARAAEIVERSARRANLPFEAGFSRHIARDLAERNVVQPSELQIVGEQVQRKRIFTPQAYRRAGGKEQFVHEYLEDVIAASEDREAAALLLRSLISEESTRLTLPLAEIARRMQRDSDAVERLLTRFVRARLVREIQDDEPWCYELMHEYLIDRINRVTGRVMDATQRANRLFRQYLSNHAVDARTRIPLAKVWFIARYSDLERGERERHLLRRSLRWGIAKAGVLAILLAAATTVAAAALSVEEEWEEARLSDGHTAAARCVAFSPDGRRLVSCGEDNRIIVWDFERRERVATLEGHTGPVTRVAYSPDGRWFATGGDDRTAIVWDAVSLRQETVIREHASSVFAVAFSPDGRFLLTSSGEVPTGRTVAWDVGSWTKAAEVQLGPWDLDFLPGYGSRVVLPTGKVWNATAGRMEAEAFPSDQGAGWIEASRDGALLATLDSLGVLRVYDVSGRRVLGEFKVHRDHGRAIAFSPDGRFMASGAEDAVLWDARTLSLVTRFEYPSVVWSLAFSPDGRWLVSSHGDGSINVWDVEGRERVANLNEHAGPVRSVSFSHDGTRLVSASDDRSVIVWDTRDGGKAAVLAGHDTRAMGAVFTPDGLSVASCDQDARVVFWDVAARAPRWVSNGNNPVPTYSIAVSPDGRWVASTKQVHDAATGETVAAMHHEVVPWTVFYGVDFSPDGTWLAVCNAYGYVGRIETETWRKDEIVGLSGAAMVTVSISPDGKMLVTGEDSGAVRLWETNPLRHVGVLGRHAARAKSVAFSPDGSQVVSAGDDRMVALWDVRSRRLVRRIGVHAAPTLSVAFSPDGRRIGVGGHDGSVRIYTRYRTLWGRRLGSDER
jgi:WD40 repeat protein